MQTVSTIVKYTCDRCGKEQQFTDDEVPAYWVHVPECDRYDRSVGFDFCPDCMKTVYDAAISNRDWYVAKLGPIPTTVHNENQYLELKQKYDQLKSEYDAITTSKPYARSSDDPIMKMDMHLLEISHPI